MGGGVVLDVEGKEIFMCTEKGGVGERETDRQTDRDRERQRETETDKQRE